MFGSRIACERRANSRSVLFRCSSAVSGNQRTLIVGTVLPVVNQSRVSVMIQIEQVVMTARASFLTNGLETKFIGMKNLY